MGRTLPPNWNEYAVQVDGLSTHPVFEFIYQLSWIKGYYFIGDVQKCSSYIICKSHTPLKKNLLKTIAHLEQRQIH